MANRKRYQFLGWIIQRAHSGWWVIDWDFEGEYPRHLARTEADAIAWACAHS